MAVCVVGFSPGIEVEHLEVHCLPGFTIFLSAFYHTVVACHWFTHWLKNTQRDIVVETSLHTGLPGEWYRNGGVVGDRLGIGIYHESHRDTCHEW